MDQQYDAPNWTRYVVPAALPLEQAVLTPSAISILMDLHNEADCSEQARLLLTMHENKKLYIGGIVPVHTTPFASLEEYMALQPELAKLVDRYSSLHAGYMPIENRILTGNVAAYVERWLAAATSEHPGIGVLHVHTHPRTTEADLRILVLDPESSDYTQRIAADADAGIYDFLTPELGRRPTMLDAISYESCTKPSEMDLATSTGATFAILTKMLAPTLADGMLVFQEDRTHPEYVRRIPVTFGTYSALDAVEEQLTATCAAYCKELDETMGWDLQLIANLDDTTLHFPELARAWRQIGGGPIDPFAPWEDRVEAVRSRAAELRAALGGTQKPL
jgi:hypothetical protein